METLLTRAQEAVVEQAIHAGVPIIVDGVHGPTGTTSCAAEEPMPGSRGKWMRACTARAAERAKTPWPSRSG